MDQRRPKIIMETSVMEEDDVVKRYRMTSLQTEDVLVVDLQNLTIKIEREKQRESEKTRMVFCEQAEKCFHIDHPDTFRVIIKESHKDFVFSKDDADHIAFTCSMLTGLEIKDIIPDETNRLVRYKF